MRIFSPFRYGKDKRGILEKKARSGMTKSIKPSKIDEYAKDMRKQPTECEKIIWDAIKDTEPKFKRQVVFLNKYIVDFYCPTKRLIIEIDGYHHYQGDQLTKDQHRDKELLNAGYKVLRFTNQQVRYDLGSVINKIRSACSGKLSTLFS